MTPQCRTTPLACRAGVWLLVVVGLILAPAPSQAQEVIEYYGTDHLGSIRVVFDAAGNVISRADYLPFGEEMFAAGPMPAEHFTGQARDGEAGLDYFHARQYQPRTGRFNAIDPIFVGPTDPQQWNRYTYARNNPLFFTDPTGAYNRPQTGCSQGNGAYWCPGDGELFIPDAGFVPSDDPLRQGYHGGELENSLALYSASQDYGFWFNVIKSTNDQKFETEQEAAAGRKNILTLATAETGWEWGENIYKQRSGSHSTGDPLTSMSPKFLSVRERVADARKHSDSLWVAGIHTHPRDDTGGYMHFSDEDKRVAKQYGFTSYVASDPNYLFRYNPRTGGVNRVW